MTDLATMTRLHFADGRSYVLIPWATVVGVFLANVLTVVVVSDDGGDGSGAMIMLAAFLVVIEIIAATKWLPFALMLGITKTRFYLGTTLLVVVVSAVWSAVGDHLRGLAPGMYAIGALAAAVVIGGLGFFTLRKAPA
jgi:hypothetical protein